MKARHARQIRAGVTRALASIAFTDAVGRPPMALYSPNSRLEKRAYDEVIVRRVIIRVRRITRKIDQLLEDES